MVVNWPTSVDTMSLGREISGAAISMGYGWQLLRRTKVLGIPTSVRLASRARFALTVVTEIPRASCGSERGLRWVRGKAHLRGRLLACSLSSWAIRLAVALVLFWAVLVFCPPAVLAAATARVRQLSFGANPLH